MKVSEVVDAVERGEIPFPLVNKTEWLGVLTVYSKKMPQVSAAVIAAARRDNFSGDEMSIIQEWRRWAEEHFEFSRGYVQHCNAVGKLLLDFFGKPELGELFKVPFGKLHSLSRLPREAIPGFLEEHDVLAMPIDAVRAEVAMRLGERPKPQAGGDETGDGLMVQPELDLWGAVDRLCQVRPEQFDELGEQIDTSDKADRVFWAGLGLVDSGIKYAKGGKYDGARIRQWGKVLVAQQNEMVAILKQVDPSFEG